MQSEVRRDSRLFRALSRALLDHGIAVRFRAEGRSMFPAIADGDVIEVDPLTEHSAGDVVLLENGDGLRAHRIVAANGDQLITRGDSCCEPDAIGTSNSILGRVTRVFSEKGGRSPHTLRTRVRQIFSSLK